jgi:hypothetical protein
VRRFLVISLIVIAAACSSAAGTPAPATPVCCNANGGVGTVPYGPTVPPGFQWAP